MGFFKDLLSPPKKSPVFNFTESEIKFLNDENIKSIIDSAYRIITDCDGVWGKGIKNNKSYFLAVTSNIIGIDYRTHISENKYHILHTFSSPIENWKKACLEKAISNKLRECSWISTTYYNPSVLISLNTTGASASTDIPAKREPIVEKPVQSAPVYQTPAEPKMVETVVKPQPEVKPQMEVKPQVEAKPQPEAKVEENKSNDEEKQFTQYKVKLKEFYDSIEVEYPLLTSVEEITEWYSSDNLPDDVKRLYEIFLENAKVLETEYFMPNGDKDIEKIYTIAENNYSEFESTFVLESSKETPNIDLLTTIKEFLITFDDLKSNQNRRNALLVRERIEKFSQLTEKKFF